MTTNVAMITGQTPRSTMRRPRPAPRRRPTITSSARRSRYAGTVAPDEPRVDLAAGHEPEPVGAEREAERLRREAVDLLQHERRAGDVGEQRAEREPGGERVAEERALREQARASSAACAPPRSRRSFGSVSGSATAASVTIASASAGEHDEDPRARSVTLQHLRADHRRQDRRQPGHEHQRARTASRPRARVEVADDRAADHDPRAAREALQEPQARSARSTVGASAHSSETPE